jgi:hypothetical protein
VHGTKAVAGRDGQLAAALAEVLVKGISQEKVRRLFAMLPGSTPALRDLPRDWTRVLPPDAPLTALERWEQVFARTAASDWPDNIDRSQSVLGVLRLVAKGPVAADEAGKKLLSGVALALWRRALDDGPAQALPVTLTHLRSDDGIEPATHVIFASAMALASAPRPYVRLLALNTGRWPRGISEMRFRPLIDDGKQATGKIPSNAKRSCSPLTFKKPATWAAADCRLRPNEGGSRGVSFWGVRRWDRAGNACHLCFGHGAGISSPPLSRAQYRPLATRLSEMRFRPLIDDGKQATGKIPSIAPGYVSAHCQAFMQPIDIQKTGDLSCSGLPIAAERGGVQGGRQTAMHLAFASTVLREFSPRPFRGPPNDHASAKNENHQ